MAVESFGDFPYYVPQDGAKVSIEYEVVVQGEEPAQADVSQVHIYTRGVSNPGNLVETKQLVKTGAGTFLLDIADLDPTVESPILLQFVFEKNLTAGPRAGETVMTQVERLLALALPAVGKIKATPSRGVTAGTEVKLEVVEWAALVFDEPETPRVEPNADVARFPAGATDGAKWERCAEGAWTEQDGTGKELTSAIAEGQDDDKIVFRAFLGGQERRPVANVYGAGFPANWRTRGYVSAATSYRQAQVAAAKS